MLRLLPCTNRENTASLCFFIKIIFIFNFIIIIYFNKLIMLIMKLSQFKKKLFNVELKLSQTSQGPGVVKFTLNQPART